MKRRELLAAAVVAPLVLSAPARSLASGGTPTVLVRMAQPKQMALRLRMGGQGALHVLRGRAAIARIDTRSIAATRAGR